MVEPLKEFFTGLIAFLPNILIAVLISALGWALAKVFQLVVSWFLKNAGFDGFVKKIGFDAAPADKKDGVAPHQFAGSVAFWGVIFFTFLSCLEKLSLSTAAAQLNQFFFIILGAFKILLVFILGVLFSFIFSKSALAVAKKTQLSNPAVFANVCKWGVLVFTLAICLFQAGFPPEIFMMGVGMIFAALCIVFILAFGIGGASAASKLLEKLIK